MPCSARPWAIPLLSVLWFAILAPLGAQQRIALDGEWRFRELGGKDWLKAQVPGTVHTDLQAAGLIPDPFGGDNAAQLQWIEQLDWEYSRHITLGEAELRHKELDLVFEGLDTYADVFVNGQWLGRADNMHRRWRFPCKPYLKAGDNAVLVRFHSTVHMALPAVQASAFPLPAGNDAGNPKVAPFVRKAAYHFGWDFAPRLVGAGIWRPAYLEAWDGARIAAVHAMPLQMTPEEAHVRVTTLLDVAEEGDYQIDLFMEGQLVMTTLRNLSPGQRAVELQYVVQKPRYWWPRGMGEPHLYRFSTEVRSGRNKLASHTQHLGLRQVRLVMEPDSIGTSFYFAINEFDTARGGPLFIKGANYVPADVFLPRGRARRQQLLESAEAVGMNMLRVWGGGVYEDDAFYDWCDAHGILVWQDLAFACMMYPLEGDFLENVRHELRDNLMRLRHHPSLAIWCGNNEMDVAWKNWGWQAEGGYTPEFAAKLWGQYQAFFESEVPALMASADPGRPYIPSSPLSNWGKEENFRHRNMHYWGVWHGSDSLDGFSHYVPRFMSEYGFQSWPSAGTLERYLSPENLRMDSPAVLHRQKSYKGNTPILRLLVPRYGQPRDFARFCYLSQLLQRDAMAEAITAQRMRQPHCMGTLYWQLNDAWPGPSWSTIEYDGRWKPAHFALGRLYAPELLSLRLDSGQVRVAFATDLPPKTCNLQLRLKTLSGDVVGDYVTMLEVRPGAREYLRMPLTAISNRIDPPRQYLEAVLHQGRNVLARAHWFLASPAELDLPDPAFNYTAVYDTAGFFDLELKARSVVKDLEIQIAGVDARLEDNFFDLLPGSTRHVRVWVKDLHDPNALTPLLRFRDLSHILAD